jgi:hypothetical protein
MSWDAQPGQPGQDPQQPGGPFPPQGWTSPTPQGPYEQGQGQGQPQYGQPDQYRQSEQYGQPDSYGQPGQYGRQQPGQYGGQGQQPGPYGQPQQPGGYGQPGGYEPTVAYGQQYPAQQQPSGYDQYGQAGQYGQGQQPGAWEQYGNSGGYYPPQPPPKKSRTGLFVGLGVGFGVIAAGVAIAVAVSSSNSPSTPVANGGSSSASAGASPSASADTASAAPSDSASSSTGITGTGHTISVPSRAGTLRLLTNADTTQRISELKSKLSGNAAYTDPQIGFYAIGSSHVYSVWLLAEDTSAIPSFQDSVTSLGAEGAAREIATAANMKNIQTEPAGPLGGAMVCGTLNENGVNLMACEWVDDSSFGWVYFMPTVSHGKALNYTLDLRGAAEK